MFKQEELESVKCSLCGSEENKLVLVRDDGLSVVECSNCGLAFVNPRPKKEVVQGIYDEEYYKGKAGLKGYSNYVDETLSSLEKKDHYGYQIIPLISKFKELKRKRLLDIGCALGAFLVIARTFGAEVEGLELSDFAAQYGREKFGLKIKTGNLEEAGYTDDCFDFVTMFDLLEHLPDPAVFLKEVFRVTKKGGVIAILTPNYFCRRKYGERWVGFTQSFEHLYFFDEGSLGKILNKAGFKLILSQTLDFSSSLQKAIFQKDDRKRGFLALRNLGLKMPVLSYIPRYLWRSYNLWLRKRNQREGFGHHLLVLAEKREGVRDDV